MQCGVPIPLRRPKSSPKDAIEKAELTLRSLLELSPVPIYAPNIGSYPHHTWVRGRVRGGEIWKNAPKTQKMHFLLQFYATLRPKNERKHDFWDLQGGVFPGSSPRPPTYA